MNRENSALVCEHCRGPLPPDTKNPRFCCAGCEAVAGLLGQEGLGRYYALAPSTLPAIGVAPAAQSHAWLEPLVAAANAAGGSLGALELDVQGIHCAGCVWLMNELLRRHRGTAITVNPTVGKVRLVYPRAGFDVAAFVADVERFGYRFGPSRKQSSATGNGLTLRLGLSAALTMNVMLFSISFYLGLSPQDGSLYRIFTWLSAVLATAVVVIGGGVFFRSALLALRRRILHLDLPIALGILLVYVTSIVRLARGQGGELAYLDTLCTFITLMLVGRWLQQRVVERNRRMLLEDDGAKGIFVRLLEGGQPRAIAVPLVKAGDSLLIAPGELVPVDATLVDAAAAISTDWITGEPEPRAVAAEALIPAGSFNAGRSAFLAKARSDFSASPLVALLRQGTPSANPGGHTRFWDRLARRWVLQVLTVSALGLLIWLPSGAGVALDVAVSLLVVTCPCAIGIALPLAYEVTQARLRRAGFFVRTPDLLDRLERVRTLIFDKTGTLTLGRLALEDDGAVQELSPEARDAAYDLASRSGHPVAGCLARALERSGAVYHAEVAVTEVPGQGLTATIAGATWRLGRAAFALENRGVDVGHDTVLSRDGQSVARFRFREELRRDAVAQVQALQGDGHQVHILSGDVPARVAAAAEILGIPAAHGHGGLEPGDKARIVGDLDRGDTLYIGDGINDSLAFERALCAGTVAVDRPVLPGKSAFFLVGDGLAPLRRALQEATRLRTVVRRVFALSLSYNVIAVSVCLAGQMSPLRAAVTMPLSSLGILLFTLWQVRERRVPARRPRAITTEVPVS
ncbi:MAG TPA: heavy metal translocating P-type ATPase metal-binding domain-containing protein [Polyangia bacterium]